MNGNSLDVDAKDAVLTDRGVSLDDGQCLLLAPPELSPSGFVFPETFTMVLWIHPTGTTTNKLLQKHSFLKVFIQPQVPSMYIRYEGSNISYLYDSIASNTYSDKWGLLSVSHETVASVQHVKLTYNSSHGSIHTFSNQPSDVSSYQFIIGLAVSANFFKGFIYTLTIYPEIINDQDYSDGNLFYIGTGQCVSPSNLLDCLSTETDPSKNSLGEECLGCDSSCDASLNCITCDASCNELCLTIEDPNGCMDMATLCFPGWYDSSNSACNQTHSCTTNCSTCSNSTDCAICETGYNLQPDLSCGIGCPSGFASENQMCVACHPNCAECVGTSSDHCTMCSDANSSVLLAPGNCSCNSEFYSNNTDPLLCSPCELPCKECSSLNHCLSCSDIEKIVLNGSCICPDGFYEAAGCEQCHSDCATCDGPLSSNCLTCVHSLKNVESDRCTCIEGYYSQNNNCLSCDLDCKTCEGSLSTDCTSCTDPNKYLKDGACVCAEGFFKEDSGSCQKCSSRCLICDGLSNCMQCEDNSSFNGSSCECDKSCYLSSSDTCEHCDGSCKACSGPESTDCLLCEDNANLNSLGKCECESGFYVKSAFPLECEVCDDSCKSCSGPSPSDCLECSDADSSVENGCICEEGYYLEDTCKECPSDCKSCRSSEGCLECLDSRKEPEEGQCECKDKYCEMNGKCLDCEAIPFENELASEGMAGAGALVGSLVISFVSMLTMEDPTVIWTITNTAQIISYLALLDLSISEPFYQFLVSYHTMNFLPNYFLSIPGDYSYPSVEYQRFGYSKKEYRDTNFIKNGGRYFEIILIVLAVYLSMFLASLILPKSLKTKLIEKTRCCGSVLIKTLLTLYLDLCVAGSVAVFRDFEQSHIICEQISLVFCSLLVSTPFVLLFFTVYKERIRSKDASVTKYIGSIYSGMNLDSPYCFYYEMLLSIRRLTYSATLYFCLRNPLVVLISQICFSVFLSLYITLGSIYKSRKETIINSFAEVALSFTLSVLIYIYSQGESSVAEFLIMGMNIFFILTASVSCLILGFFKFLCEKKKEKTESNYPQVVIIGDYKEDRVFSPSHRNNIPCQNNSENKLNLQKLPQESFSSSSRSAIDNTCINSELMIKRREIPSSIIYVNNIE